LDVLKKGNENPFLHGKAPKKHFEFRPVLQPDPLNNLTGERRQEVVRLIGAQSKAEFDKQLQNIRELLGRYNPFQLLAHLCYYDQLVLDGKKDSEYEPIDQCMVEWLQALVLMIPETDLSQSLDSIPEGDVLTGLNASLHSVQQSYSMMRLGKEHENSEAAVVAEMMRQQTAFIRNDGFPSQIRRLQEEVFRSLDQEFERREGYRLSDIVDVLWKLSAVVETRLNVDLELRRRILGQKTSDKIIEQFAPVIGQDAAKVKQEMAGFFDDVKKVRVAITNHLDAHNFRFFYFNESDIRALFRPDFPADKIGGVLDALSLAWGSLKDGNPEHFILDNPVWNKPIIAVGNRTYFFPIVGMIQSFGLQVVEQFLKLHPDLEKSYHDDVRSDFLEKRTETALRAAFPIAEIYRGLKWTDENGVIWENDLLVLFDTHALVFECKSGQMRARAQRGDIPALKRELDKLVGDPTRQGRRFADFILAVRGNIKLKDATGKVRELSLGHIIRATTVNVTMEYFGSLGAQHHLLRESGLLAADLAPAATIPLHDLECIFDILNEPAQVCHYLRRRAEIEAANEMYSDELSLLATYLATSFDFGEVEGNKEHKFMLKSMGDALIPYFMGKDLHTPTPKPQLRLAAWWREMLTKFAQTQFPGWVEASYGLLCVGFERQKEFEKATRGIKKEVKHHWHTTHNDTVMMAVGTAVCRTVILTVSVKNKTREEARLVVQERMSHAAEKYKATRVLAVCVSAATKVHPYLGAYFWCPELEQLGSDGPGIHLG
jgi:hypothetical protein